MLSEEETNDTPTDHCDLLPSLANNCKFVLHLVGSTFTLHNHIHLNLNTSINKPAQYSGNVWEEGLLLGFMLTFIRVIKQYNIKVGHCALTQRHDVY